MKNALIAGAVFAAVTALALTSASATSVYFGTGGGYHGDPYYDGYYGDRDWRYHHRYWRSDYDHDWYWRHRYHHDWDDRDRYWRHRDWDRYGD
jgi:hypothetical protein